MEIMLLVDLLYPCDHSFLEEVYVKRLTRAGYKIVWVMRDRTITRVETGTWGENKVYRIPSYGTNSVTEMVKTALATIAYVPGVLKKEKSVILQVRNDPLMGMLASWHSKKLKKRFMYQYTFYKSKSYADKKNLSAFLKYHAGQYIEKTLIGASEYTFVISRTMKQELERAYGFTNLIEMPLGVDEEILIDERKMEVIKDTYHLKDHVLIYLGSLSSARRPEILVQILKTVLKEIQDVQLLIVGDSGFPQDVNHLKALFEKKHINAGHVIFTGKVPRKEIYEYLLTAQIGLSLIPPIPIYKIASPIKLADYMNAGIPVVANKGIIEQDEIISDSQGGLLTEYGAEEISRAIIWLLKNPEYGKQYGENGKIYIRRNKNYTMLANRIVEYYGSKRL